MSSHDPPRVVSTGKGAVPVEGGDGVIATEAVTQGVLWGPQGKHMGKGGRGRKDGGATQVRSVRSRTPAGGLRSVSAGAKGTRRLWWRRMRRCKAKSPIVILAAAAPAQRDAPGGRVSVRARFLEPRAS